MTTPQPDSTSTATELSCPMWLLDYVQCPITRTPLKLASKDLLANLHSYQSTQPLSTRVGRTISSLPLQGLVDQTQSWLYPIHDQIPTLVPDEAIAVPTSCRIPN